ncbi:MAG: DUF5131 family protein [Pseudonocardiaceae bacterium]
MEWTEATWNPTTGCDQVSSGCICRGVGRRRSASCAVGPHTG